MKNKLKLLLPLVVIFITFFIVENGTTNMTEVSSKVYDDINTDRIPVLTFHRLVPDHVKKEKYANNQWIGSIDVFAEMMEWLYVNGYETISTEDFYEWYIGNREYSPKTVLITFDDGFYEDYYLVYPILKKYNFKATSFIVGSRINLKTPKYNETKIGYIGEDVVNKMREEYPNFEFQSHSYNMHYYTKDRKHRIKSMSIQEMEADTISNEVYGFTTMAYPYGDYNIYMEKVLEEQGYLCAFRFGPSKYATRNSDRFAIPRIKINGFATINDMIKWVKY